MSLLALPPILGWALVLAQRLPGRPGAAIFFAVSAVVSILYALACGGLLWLGATLLFYVGDIALILFLAQRRASALRFLFSVPCVIFVCCGVIHWFVLSEARYHFWDEFAQWGLVVREIISTHELYGFESNARRPTAPPAAALWCYFVCANTGYSEGATYFAQFLLLMAPLLPMYERLSFRKPGWVALAAALQLLLLANLGRGVTSLFVDHILGAIFAGILFIHVADPKSRRVLAFLALPLFVLTLVKESGVFLAASAALFLVLHHLANRAGTPKDPLGKLLGDRRLAAILCLVMLAPAVAVTSWQLRLMFVESGGSPRSVWGIGSRVLSRPDFEESQRELVQRRFLGVFLEQPMSRSEVSLHFNAFNYLQMPQYRDSARLSTLGWLIFYVLASALGWLCAPNRRLKRAIGLLTPYLLAVFAVYALVLLRVYVTDKGHGALLSSYVRYMNTLLLPMVLLSLAWFLPAASLRHSEVRQRWSAPILTVVVVVLYVIETPYFKPLYTVAQEHDFRRITEPWTEHIAALIEPGRNLFVYFPHSDAALARWILTYQLTPVPVTVRTRLPDQGALREALAHDYIWLSATTPELEATLSQTLGHAVFVTEAVYRVERRQGKVLLVPIYGRARQDAEPQPPSRG